MRQRLSGQDIHHHAIQEWHLPGLPRTDISRGVPVEEGEGEERRGDPAQHLGHGGRRAVQIHHASILPGRRDRAADLRPHRARDLPPGGIVLAERAGGESADL